MKQPSILFAFSAAIFLFASCEKNDRAFTIAEGSVINKYTGQPVPAVPIAVYRVFSTRSGPVIDSLTATETDADGHYKLLFDATKSASYEVVMTRPQDLYDIDRGDFRPKAEPGTTTRIDFSVTPYKTVTLDVNSSKGGKTAILFSYYLTDKTIWFPTGTIYSDTLGTSQNVIFSRTCKVIPNCTYRFTKITANRYKIAGTNNYEFKESINKDVTRLVGYNDTTVIKFR